MASTKKFVMTPGPTRIPDEILMTMAKAPLNPDVDPEFGRFYRSLTDKLADVHDTDHDIVIMGGEGILGLEAAVASTIQPGDEVLCLSNGIYGDGFTDFVEMYGGEPVVVSAPFTEPFDLGELESVVTAADHDFAAATMVHCETPTGLLNDLDPILEILDEADILTIVDAVSSLAGTPVPVDDIDICLGASQKCLSAPPGLTTVAMSERAWEQVDDTPQQTFYTSLEPWRNVDPLDDAPTAFPYTHLVSNLYALEAAVDRVLNEGLADVYDRHEDVAGYCREYGEQIGLEPYPPEELCSPTVTAFEIPGEAERVRRRLYEDYNVVVATSLGEFSNNLLRIGHMGYGAHRGAVGRVLEGVNTILNE